DKQTRLIWGGLRNLLSGVTTVSEHNHVVPVAFCSDFPVRVPTKFNWAHSLTFDRDVKRSHSFTKPNQPFIIHAGEGITPEARQEIHTLAEMGVIDDRAVLVHALAFDEPGIQLIRRAGAAIVWCPSSNHFLFNKTLEAETLDSGVLTALGT